MTLRRIDEGLWSVDLPFSLLGVAFGLRSPIVRLPSGGLLLCSPGPIEEGDFQAIEELGEVEAILAPNTFHHLYVKRAATRFERAKLFYARGLQRKVPTLPPGEELGDEPPSLFGGVLEQQLIEGSITNEIAFLHRPSRSLILTDLAFNIQKGGLWTRLIMKLNGGFGRFGPTRLLRSSIRDAAAFQRSIEAIASWDFDRILVAHGDIVEEGGQAIFAHAFGIETAPALSGVPLQGR